MEEDINAIKNDIYGLKNFLTDTEKVLWQNAIENLIKGYRELEEAVDNFMKGKAYSTKQIEDIDEKYIPKSKVKEKIEEYQTDMKKYEKEVHNIFNENNIRQEVITVLTELLMEGK